MCFDKNTYKIVFWDMFFSTNKIVFWDVFSYKIPIESHFGMYSYIKYK